MNPHSLRPSASRFASNVAYEGGLFLLTEKESGLVNSVEVLIRMDNSAEITLVSNAIAARILFGGGSEHY